ncbi:MAG: hypothetical protein NT150_10965 [Bacteroidetes bacterium]|nr:hypothetical protein [Bacteroidota bacterium]
MNKKELWLVLANYNFDHLVPAHFWDLIASKFGGRNPYTLAFADKLCNKLNWSRDFAMKAIWEYKKFVFLGVTSDFGVTPSKIIDKVWHEHLLFTVGYRKFCEEVIHYEFNHHPELVPIERQNILFQKQYFRTLELYAKEFGNVAPDDIWGDAKFTKKDKKHLRATADSSSSYDGGSADYLISAFPEADSSSFEFGNGEFGGGGAESGWDDGSGGGDGDSDGGGDSGSDGGSSCSSSCGGGCGGD